MGNSLRHTLGNLCGGEAAKTIDADENQRPVAQPKKEKKEKRLKKNKKLKNGNLSKIPEEKTEEQQFAPVEESKLTDLVDNTEVAEKNDFKTEENPSDQSAKQLTLKEQASESSLSKLDDSHDNKHEEDDSSDVIEHDNEVNSEEEKEHMSSTTSSRDVGSLGETFGSGVQTDSKNGLFNSKENIEQKLDHFHIVEKITPELLSIGYADEIFNKAVDTYLPFVEHNEEFKSAVLEFGQSVDPEKTKPDFERCWKLYTDLIGEENDRAVENVRRTESKSNVDVCDVNVNLQAIRRAAITLIATIKQVRPQYEHCVTECGNVDVIEYVKGKMIEGEHLGITSKFSAPGKYRRNMKQLKNGLCLLNSVEYSTIDILKLVESRFGSVSKKKMVYDEVTIEPISKTDSNNDECDEDIFAKLQDDTPSTDGSVSPSENVSEDYKPEETLLEKSNSTRDRSVSPTSVDETYIIQTLPEVKEAESSHGSVNDTTKRALTQPKTQITQVVVEEEAHNTLDFGKYIFVDPSTGDIQVMRNRSRSLDSLVSIQSHRSSLSRFGSFEFVTDFEINIAEKNQNKLI